MSKRFGRPGKMHWRNREQSQVFNQARQNPEPVKIICEGGRMLETPRIEGVTPEEIFKAYDSANAGTVHGAETTLDELLGKSDVPW